MRNFRKNKDFRKKKKKQGMSEKIQAFQKKTGISKKKEKKRIFANSKNEITSSWYVVGR